VKERYLEITFRKGRALAAYLYLPRQPGAKSARTQEMRPGIRADYSAAGEAIGLEITAPARVTAEDVNLVLKQLGVPPLAPEEFAPIKAA
jgi:uncharacterized protein YuzE